MTKLMSELYDFRIKFWLPELYPRLLSILKPFSNFLQNILIFRKCFPMGLRLQTIPLVLRSEKRLRLTIYIKTPVSNYLAKKTYLLLRIFDLDQFHRSIFQYLSKHRKQHVALPF